MMVLLLGVITVITDAVPAFAESLEGSGEDIVLVSEDILVADDISSYTDTDIIDISLNDSYDEIEIEEPVDILCESDDIICDVIDLDAASVLESDLVCDESVEIISKDIEEEECFGSVLADDLLFDSAPVGSTNLNRSNYEANYNRFISDYRWRNGASYYNEGWFDSKGEFHANYFGKFPYISSHGATGCWAYGDDFVKYMYGIDSYTAGGEKFYNRNDIRDGDVIRVGDGHTVVVLERNGDRLYTAEAAYNDDYYGSGVVRVTDSVYTTQNCKFLYGYHFINIGSNSSPDGRIDSISGDENMIYVGGWALDPDSPSEKLQVNVYVEGYRDPIAFFKTHIYRQIAGGTYCGFDEAIDISSMNLSGTKTISLWAIDVTGDENAEIGSKVISFTEPRNAGIHTPTGHIDSIGGGEDKLYVGGWALDPDSPSEKLQVNVYVEGYRDPIASFKTHIYRQIAGGTYCGFDEIIDVSSMNLSGTKTISLWAIDVTENDNAEIGSAEIEFSKSGKSGSESPIGHIDSAGGNAEILYLGGWAYDPDDTGENVQINVYVEGYRNPIASFNTHIYRQIAGGTYCGFDEAIDIASMNLSGTKKISLWAIDATGNDNAEIGSAQINFR